MKGFKASIPNGYCTVKFTFFSVILIAAFIGLQADVNICSGVVNSVFLPTIDNCSNYYICMKQKPILRSCPTGDFFDRIDQQCTYQSTARCVPKCTHALSSYYYDRTCTKYVLCYGGTPVLRACADGLQYNRDTNHCDFPHNVDCVENLCTIFNHPNDITYIPSFASCEKYYICMDGNILTETCSKGLQFNPACNCCDFPSNFKCNATTLHRNIASFTKEPSRGSNIE